MKTLKLASKMVICGIATAWLATTASSTHATTIWNGPNITFTHSSATGELVDHLTSGVSLTRGSFGGLYNTPAESGATPGVSPSDTKWAVGSLANYNTLSYGACPLEQGNHPPGDVNKTYVVHLVAEDIYLSITLTGWGGAGGAGDKSFAYTRSTAAVVTPPTPTVTITSPVSGAVFAAPADVSLAASAAVSSGTVTNVQFFTNGVVLGSVLTAPFTLTANNLAAGVYALKAVATAAGVSATSSVVNISVVLPPTISLTNPASGTVLAAPASLRLAVAASVIGGSVTNVQFFTNGVSAGSVLTAPFNLTVNNQAAGAYALTATATAGGISATSAVVNLSVVNPVAASLSGGGVKNGQFTFNCTANAGLSYVLQSSTNLQSWVSLVTNVAPGSAVLFTNPVNSTGINFYRVGRLPNP